MRTTRSGRYTFAVHSSQQESVESPPVSRDRASRWRSRVAWLGLIGGSAAAGWLMTGPAPKPAPAARFPDPPPYVVRDDVPRGSLERQAASALIRGDFDAAAVLFDRQATEDPGNPRPAVGLVLARWKRSGAKSAIRSLDRIGRENPNEPWVALERGLARVITRSPNAERVLNQALRQARARDDQRDVARVADDVLHPSIAPGYPPMLIRAFDTTDALERSAITQLDVAVLAGDRVGALRIAQRARSSRPSASTALLVAIEVASFSKDRPLQSLAALERIRDAATPGSEHAMASLHHALVEIWVRGPEQARVELQQVARDRASGRWGRQARALDTALSKRA